MAIETERKWLLAKFPEMPDGASAQDLIQAYLITDPGELRIRSDGETAWITCKGDGTFSRQEWEEELPTWAFDQMLTSATCRITKRRYTLIDETGQKLEIDIYAGDLMGLVTVEAEWTTSNEANRPTLEAKALAYELPEWIGEATEVTKDKRYKNKNLATNGRPSD